MMNERLLENLGDAQIVLATSCVVPLRLQPDATFQLSVSVMNEGPTALSWTGEHPLRIAYRWLDENGDDVERDGERTPVAMPLLSNSNSTFEVRGRTPISSGRFLLLVSLILEGVHWACDVSANGWIRVSTEVAATSDWPAMLEKSPGGKALRGALAAKSLQRRLIEHSFNASFGDPAPRRDEERRTPISRKVQLPGVATQRRTLGRRVRAWLRHLLGIPEMREAIEALLTRSSDQQQQLAQMGAQLAELQTQEKTLAGHFAFAQEHLGALSAQAERIVPMQEQLAQYARGTEQRLRNGRSALDRLRRASAKHEAAVSSIARDVRTLAEAVEAARADISEDLRSGKFVSRALTILEALEPLAQHSADLELLAAIGKTVERIPAFVKSEAELAGARIADRLRESEVARELLSNLRTVSQWTEKTGDLSQFGAIREEVNRLPLVIERQSELTWERTANELRGGEVAIELVTTLRGLAQWMQSQRANLGVLEVYASSTGAKVDSLMARETIPVSGAGLVLSRNRFGFLAIQDDDLPAIAYYSSGELPEAGTVALVERVLQPGDTFLDVGANVGAYALVAARKVGPSGKVVAIEPVPSTSRMLGLTIAINGIGGIVELHQCALGASDAQARIYTAATSGHCSMIESDETHESIDVEVRQGSSVLGKRKPRMIKIDVEGWELEVLEGLKPHLKSASGVALIVECSPVYIRRKGLTTEEWLKRLRAFGKNIWLIGNDSPSLRPLIGADIDDCGANLFVSSELPSALTPLVQ